GRARRLAADRDHELTLDRAAVFGHRLRLAVEAGRDLVVDRVGPGLDGGDPPYGPGGLAGVEGAEGERVGLRDGRAGRRCRVEVLRVREPRRGREVRLVDRDGGVARGLVRVLSLAAASTGAQRKRGRNDDRAGSGADEGSAGRWKAAVADGGLLPQGAGNIPP